VKNNILNNKFADNLPKVSLPLEMPDGYLDNISNLVLDQIKNEHFLDTLSKKNVYAVPNNYFESFTIGKNNQVKTYNWVKKLFAIAAIVVVSVGVAITYQYYRAEDGIVNYTVSNNLPLDEVNSYLALHLDEFTTEQLLNASVETNSNIQLEIEQDAINQQEAQEFIEQESIEEFL
jgi:hypothetical protein